MNANRTQPTFAAAAQDRARRSDRGGRLRARIESQLSQGLVITYEEIADVIEQRLDATMALGGTYEVDELIRAARLREVYSTEVPDAETLAPLLADYLSGNCDMQASPDGSSIEVSVRESTLPVAPPAPDPVHVGVEAAVRALSRHGLLVDANSAQQVLEAMGLLPASII